MKKTLLLASILPFLVACNSSDTSGDNDIDTGIKPIQPIEPAPPVHPIEPGEPVHPIEPEHPVHPIEPETPVHPIEPGEPINPIEPVVPMYQAVADHFQKTYDQIHDLCESDYHLNEMSGFHYEMECRWSESDETFSVYYQEKTDTSNQVADITLIFNNELLNDNYIGVDLKHRTAITQRVFDVEDFSLVTYYRDNIHWEVNTAHSFEHIHAQTRHQAVVMNHPDDKTMPRDFLRMSEELTFGIESTFLETEEGQLTARFKYYQPSVFYKLNDIFNN
ncbi:hypothetical protein [Vibrio jasicida]|uniref:hypothetical protein n=1 Tax=Vibrio jasicida TaxID=766224 RepID=UPI000696A226|nr:hypothetical protein [Vibrio jasicida]